MTGDLYATDKEKLRRLAVELIERHIRNRALYHGREWTRAWNEYCLRWSESEPAYLRMPEECLSRLLEDAEQHFEIFELVKFIVATRLDAGISTPSPLVDFISGYLKGNIVPPKKKRGPNNVRNWGQKFIVVSTLNQLQFYSEYPVIENKDQRGVRRRKPILSKILADAMQQVAEVNIEHNQIHEMWANTKERDDIIAIKRSAANSLLKLKIRINWI